MVMEFGGVYVDWMRGMPASKPKVIACGICAYLCIRWNWVSSRSQAVGMYGVSGLVFLASMTDLGVVICTATTRADVEVLVVRARVVALGATLVLGVPSNADGSTFARGDAVCATFGEHRVPVP